MSLLSRNLPRSLRALGDLACGLWPLRAPTALSRPLLQPGGPPESAGSRQTRCSLETGCGRAAHSQWADDRGAAKPRTKHTGRGAGDAPLLQFSLRGPSARQCAWPPFPSRLRGAARTPRGLPGCLPSSQRPLVLCTLLVMTVPHQNANSQGQGRPSPTRPGSAARSVLVNRAFLFHTCFRVRPPRRRDSEESGP